MIGHPIPDLLASRSRSTPDDEVLVIEGDRRYTASQLDTAVAYRAGAIAEQLEGDHQRIGISTPSRHEALLDVLATIRAGGVATPVDPGLARGDYLERIESGGLDGLIIDDDLADEIGVSERDIARVQTTASAAPIHERSFDPHSPCTMLFTSGTQGVPKPIVHTWWNHVAAAIASADRLGVEPDDRWYDPLALYHMGGLAPISRCLVAGIPLVISRSVTADRLLQRIDTADASIASVVPTMVHTILEADGHTPDALRCLLVGGAPLRESLFDRARSRGIPIWSSYGLTETVGQVTTATPAERSRHPGTVGTPLLGISVRVVEGGEPCPPERIGTIEITGEMVTPSAGAGDGGQTGTLVTNDLGYRDAFGRLWVVGRVDDVIQTGGKLVHPFRIKQVLESHPGVSEAAVVGLPDDRWGELVSAAVIPSDVEVTIDELLDRCRQALPSHAIPRHIEHVDTLPRTPSGTVDRTALRERLSR